MKGADYPPMSKATISHHDSPGHQHAAAEPQAFARAHDSDRAATGVTGNHRLNQWSNLVRQRMMIFIAIMFMLLTIIGSVSYASLKQTLNHFEQVIDVELLQMRRLVFLQDTIREASFPVHSYIAYGDTLERQVFRDTAHEVEEALKDALHSSNLSQKQQEYIATAKNEWTQARILAETILNTPFPIPAAKLERHAPLFENHIEGAKDVIYHVHNLTLAHIDELRTETFRDHRRTEAITIAGYVTGILTFLAAVYAVFRFILQPLATLKQGAERFTTGDLTYRIPIQSSDEFGELADAFNKMASFLEKDQKRLAEMATRDGLTGLYNRSSFENMLQDELERFQRHKHPMTLMILDLDHFKLVNDNYGHLTGDDALKLVSRIINKICRTGDVIARFGGEEIVILMPETPAENATVLAERIRTAIAAAPVKLGNGEQISITTSIGVASIPNDADTAESLILAADFALYEAKRAGRNCVRRASQVRHMEA